MNDYIYSFDDLGGTDDFTTDELAYVLSIHKVLNYEADRYCRIIFLVIRSNELTFTIFVISPFSSEELSARQSRAGVNQMRLERIRGGEYDNLSDDEANDDYN